MNTFFSNTTSSIRFSSTDSIHYEERESSLFTVDKTALDEVDFSKDAVLKRVRQKHQIFLNQREAKALDELKNNPAFLDEDFGRGLTPRLILEVFLSFAEEEDKRIQQVAEKNKTKMAGIFPRKQKSLERDDQVKSRDLFNTLDMFDRDAISDVCKKLAELNILHAEGLKTRQYCLSNLIYRSQSLIVPTDALKQVLIDTQ